MSNFYIDADRPFLDYEAFGLPGVSGLWRGPAPATDLTPGTYAVALGASQTFGRFVEKPFPQLLAERIGMPVLNLGIGGAGAFSFRRRDLGPLISGAKFCIVQAMSARSVPTFYFDPFSGENVFGLDKSRMGPAAFAETVLRHVLAQDDPALARRVMHTLRRGWTAEYYWLARRIKSPKILLWFAEREIDYEAGTASLESWIGRFPHGVDNGTWQSVQPHYQYAVEVISSRGRPHVLMRAGKPVELDMGNGRKVPENRYYPSPAMHEDAAVALEGICGDLAKDRTPKSRFSILSREPLSRSMPEPDKIKPNFLIIGAAKSGTSAVAVQLAQHPDIFIPDAKELHLFDRQPQLRLDPASPAWQAYLAHFAGAKDFRLRGEATVAYTMFPLAQSVPEKIMGHLGPIKLIYIVRDPLDRIVSQYRHARRDDPKLVPFEDWVLTSEAQRGAVERSNYLQQLQPFINLFGQERVKVIFYEDYRDDYRRSLEEICVYLGADWAGMSGVPNLEVNKTSETTVPVPRLAASVRDQLRLRLRADTQTFLARYGKPTGYWPSMA